MVEVIEGMTICHIVFGYVHRLSDNAAGNVQAIFHSRTFKTCLVGKCLLGKCLVGKCPGIPFCKLILS